MNRLLDDCRLPSLDEDRDRQDLPDMHRKQPVIPELCLVAASVAQVPPPLLSCCSELHRRLVVEQAVRPEPGRVLSRDSSG